MHNPLTSVYQKIPPKARTPILAVTFGGIGYIAWQRRKAAAQAEANAGSNTDPGGDTAPAASSVTSGAGSSGSGGGVVVLGGGTGSTDGGTPVDVNGLLGTVTGWGTDLLSFTDNLSQRVFDNAAGTQNEVLALMQSGTGNQSQPAQVTVNVPAPSVTVQSDPSPVQTQATVSAPAVDPTMGGVFTHKNNQTGQFYRIEYDPKTKKTWHIYADGHKVLDN